MSRIRLHPLAFLAGMLVFLPAGAIPGTTLDLYGRVGWAHDDNLLRIDDNAPAFDNQRSDSWTTFEFGAVYDKSIARQRLLAVARLSKVKYDHFSQLDYDGRDLQATWYWQLGNRFSGQLGATLGHAALAGANPGRRDPRGSVHPAPVALDRLAPGPAACLDPRRHRLRRPSAGRAHLVP